MLTPFLAALLAAAPPPAASPVPARPHWRVDWGSPRCMLVREASLQDPAMIARFVPGDRRFEVWIIDPRWQAKSFGAEPPVQLVMDPDAGAPIQHFLFLPVGNTGLRAVAVENAGEDFFERLVKARALSLRRKGVEILSIPVPGAAAAVAAARQCEDNMLRTWGVDPAVFRTLKEQPKPVRPDSWLSPSDYPQRALLSNATGTSVARVDVAASGKVTGCAIVVTSGSADLDKATCGAALHGKFSPAVAADGRPVSAFTIFCVRWRLFG